ncbi:MAG: N-acetyltransferase [Verrucomicrobiae bacterium]|nr:N-acetyltransferase [Verrucomicrobiae bacterium]
MVHDYFVHEEAINESEDIGEGTRIWGFSHIMAGVVVGRLCNIGEHCFLEGGVRVGDGVTIKNQVHIWEGVILNDYVFIGPNVVFTNDRFPRSPRNEMVSGKYATKDWLVPTVICEGASLGANSTICCGITVGRYAMVGAGAVVTKDVDEHALVYGNPARQAGWVCFCGQTLVGDEQLVCKKCGAFYCVVNGRCQCTQKAGNGQ